MINSELFTALESAIEGIGIEQESGGVEVSPTAINRTLFASLNTLLKTDELENLQCSDKSCHAEWLRQTIGTQLNLDTNTTAWGGKDQKVITTKAELMELFGNP
jgi:hypothetical protein